MSINESEKTQTIGVPLTVGSRVTLLEDVDINDDTMGSAALVSFEDYVAQYVPQTGKLRFEDSDIGNAEFLSMMKAADGVEVLKE